MKELIIFLLMFSGCTFLVIDKVNEMQRCDPVCSPYAYEYTSAKGECVCNLQKVKRKGE